MRYMCAGVALMAIAALFPLDYSTGGRIGTALWFGGLVVVLAGFVALVRDVLKGRA